MDSFNYNPDSEVDSEDGFSGLLEIYVHHARNIHNICIYDNQDVYAKFSLTYSPDEAISTRIINGGGKNPDFNECLRMKVAQVDSVLKCEIWMLSRARNYMEDQLLGFALVPMSLVSGKGKVTQDFTLSSTDLFHSPAGTIHLTLFLNTSVPHKGKSSESNFSSSISSEVVLLNRKALEVGLDPVEYERIEFPDINVVRENQQMVSEYVGSVSRIPVMCGAASFLHLGAFSQSPEDYDMTEFRGSASPNGSIQNSGFFESTTTSLSDDRNSNDSMEKKNHVSGSISVEAHRILGTSPETPTSKKENNVGNEKNQDFSTKETQNSDDCSPAFGQVFKAPLGNSNAEAEQSAMQQQIVDMYMRSMQQFTESLAKMKLPMDLDKPESHEHGDIIQQNNTKRDKKKDTARVFYGSRAFF